MSHKHGTVITVNHHIQTKSKGTTRLHMSEKKSLSRVHSVETHSKSSSDNRIRDSIYIVSEKMPVSDSIRLGMSINLDPDQTFTGQLKKTVLRVWLHSFHK